MKKLLFTLLIGITTLAYSQAPQQISYQGVARNASGTVLANQPIGIRFDIHQDSASGSIVFSETHTGVLTNGFGLFTTYIGSISNLSVINWATNSYFIEVSIDPNTGTYSSLGSQQLMSVPYALNAGSAPAPAVSFTNNILSVGGNTTTISAITPTLNINAPNTVTNPSAGVYSITVPSSTPYTLTANSNTLTIDNGTSISTATVPVATLYTLTATSNSITLNNGASVSTVTVPVASLYTLTANSNTITLDNGITVTTATVPAYSAGAGISISASGVITNTASSTSLPSAYNGQLLYNNGSIWDTIPQNKMFYDLTNTYVGIGTNSPAYNLHVVGTGAFLSSMQTPHVITNTVTVSGGTLGQVLTSDGSGNGTFQNLPVAQTPTITSTGIAVVTPTTGNTFNVDVPVPVLSYTAGTNVLSLSQGTTVTTATLNGTGSNTVSIVGSGLATVTPTTGSTFTVSVPNPTLSVGSGSISISGGNSVAIPSSSTSLVAGNLNLTLFPSGNTYTLDVKSYSLTANSNTLTLSNGASISTATVPASSTTTLTQGANVNVTGSPSNYTVSAPAYSITLPGGNVVQITNGVSTSTAPIAATNLTLNGANNNILSAGGNTVALNTYSAGTGISVTGTAPSFTISNTSPAVTPTITGTGVATVNNVSPNYTVNVPMSIYNNNTGVFTTGTQTIAVTPTLSLAGNVLRSGPTTNTVSLPTPTVVSGNSNITVTPSGNTYSVSAVTPTLSVTGGALSGTYPTQTLTIPTSSTTVISPSTNISVAGTAPNYTISSVTPTLSVIGGALSGSYPNQTLTIPTSSTTVITPSTNIIVAGTAPNYTLSSVTPTLTGTAGITVSGTYPNQTISSTQGLSIASNSIITLTPAGGNITITPAALTYTPSTNVLRLTDGLAINTHTLNNYTQGAGISVTGTAPNFTISNTSPAVTPTITGTGVATVNNVSPNYTVNVPMSTYNNNTGVFTTGTQTIAVTPTLTLSGTTLQSGSTTNTVNLSSINNWSVTSGVIYPSTLTNSVGVGINNSLGGRLGVSHASSPASPHINIISPTISDFGRVKFSNTGSSRYFSFEARNNTGGVADAFNIAHNNGTNERQVFLINGDRNVFINNLNLPLTTFHVMTSTATAQGGIASEGFGQSGQLNLVRNNNAGAGPRTQVLINEELGKLNFAGHDGSTYGDGAKIYAKTTENVTTGTRGTELIFAAVPTGTNSNKDAFKINGTGNLEVISGLRIPLGAVAGHVLTSDATGNASWQPGAGLSPWIQGASIVTLSNITDKVGIGTNTPNASLDIKNNAASLDGLALDINNPSNGSNGLQLRHFGIGNAAYIEVNNSGSTASAIQAQHNGVGTVIYAINTNSTNTAAVIQANSNSSGVAIYGTNSNGATSQFDNFSSSAAINAINYNTGNAINANASSGRAINASSSGSTTPTANFSNSNSGDVIMSFAGTGRAIYAQTGANGMATSELTNTGTGPVVFAYKNAGTTGGVVANYANNSNTNSADVVLSYNNGVGAAVHAANNPSNLSSALSLWVENGHIKATGTNATSSTTVTSISTSTVIGNDVVGKISITTVATAIPANQEMIKLTFAKDYPSGVTPNVIITPSNANAAGVQGYVSTVSNTGFSIFFNVGTAAIVRTYTFNYMVIE